MPNHYNTAAMESVDHEGLPVPQLRLRCQRGLDELGLAATEKQLDHLVAYLEMLQQWNRSYNLTAVRDPLQAVDRHIIDSLSISPWLHPGPALDAGSGAGLPGIPLAIMRPQQHWLLLDSNGKKVRFLRHVTRSLKLSNVVVMQQRLERLLPTDLEGDMRPVQIVSRAFAPLRRQCAWAQVWLHSGCSLLAMVGAVDRDDISALPDDIVLVESIPLPPLTTVASAPQQRHLLILRRRAKH